MTMSHRVLAAALVVLLDFAAFAVPLMALAVAYVLVARPPGFLRWVIRLYEDHVEPPQVGRPANGG